MSNADNFKNRRLRDCRLSPSHTDWISDCPYTSPLGLFTQDVSPPSVIWITHPRLHEDMFSLRDVCPNALSRDVFTYSLSTSPTRTLLVLHQGWEVGTNNNAILIHPKRSPVPRNSVIPLAGNTLSFYAYGLLHCIRIGTNFSTRN